MVLAKINRPPLRDRVKTTHENRWYGARKILWWLETFPGVTWQERWQASPASMLGPKWTDVVLPWLNERGDSAREEALRSGLLCLFVADVIRPDLPFLLRIVQTRYWREAVVVHRDPAGFARIEESADPFVLSSRPGLKACTQIAMILLAKGGGVSDITVGDCIELRLTETVALAKRGGDSRFLFYSLLKNMGQFPPDAPATLRALTVFSGQFTPAELVDRYQPASPRSHRRLPLRTPTGPGLRQLRRSRARARPALLEESGNSPPWHLLSPPGPQRRIGLERADPDQDRPSSDA
ncbi:hypothetical protein ACFC0C_38925 [Streptomyces sp. NPDC056178]|uniref:hypothetical protein n=1 Tax=Streptomyces sp. NPDC056178 TaxID=3345735 RepID=UPI0035E0CE53